MRLLLFFSAHLLKTVVYIDAFNLYYGAVKNTPYKWLDPSRLCQALLTGNEIIGYEYFTARLTPRDGGAGQPMRQRIYLRALSTIPSLSITYGHFLVHQVRMRLVEPQPGGAYADVIKTEEKGSDVNLATKMLIDAFDDRYECAVVISGDSDLVAPIKAVREKFGKLVGVINPQKRPCKALQREADFYKHIRRTVLGRCQFPSEMEDEAGSFNRPDKWRD